MTSQLELKFEIIQDAKGANTFILNKSKGKLP